MDDWQAIGRLVEKPCLVSIIFDMHRVIKPFVDMPGKLLMVLNCFIIKGIGCVFVLYMQQSLPVVQLSGESFEFIPIQCINLLLISPLWLLCIRVLFASFLWRMVPWSLSIVIITRRNNAILVIIQLLDEPGQYAVIYFWSSLCHWLLEWLQIVTLTITHIRCRITFVRRWWIQLHRCFRPIDIRKSQRAWISLSALLLIGTNLLIKITVQIRLWSIVRTSLHIILELR